MRVILLTSDYHISANTGVKAFLESTMLKKNGIEIAGLIVADQFNLNPRSLKRTWRYFKKLDFAFFFKQIITNVWKQLKMYIGRYFLKSKKRDYISMKELAKKYEIPFLQVRSINSQRAEDFIKEKKPEILVSCFLLEILKKRILDIPKKGSINVHPALMQQHRGTFTSFWAILNKWHKSGVTIHYMTEKVDEGEVLAQKRFFVLPTDTIHSINIKSSKLGGKLLAKTLVHIQKGRARSFQLRRLGKMFTIPTAKDIKTFYNRKRSSISTKEFFKP